MRDAGGDRADYPFWGITTKSMQYSSGNVGIPLMDEVARNIRGHGRVIMNAGAARIAGPADGDWVEIESTHGSTRAGSSR